MEIKRFLTRAEYEQFYPNGVDSKTIAIIGDGDAISYIMLSQDDTIYETAVTAVDSRANTFPTNAPDVWYREPDLWEPEGGWIPQLEDILDVEFRGFTAMIGASQVKANPYILVQGGSLKALDGTAAYTTDIDSSIFDAAVAEAPVMKIRDIIENYDIFGTQEQELVYMEAFERWGTQGVGEPNYNGFVLSKASMQALVYAAYLNSNHNVISISTAVDNARGPQLLFLSDAELAANRAEIAKYDEVHYDDWVALYVSRLTANYFPMIQYNEQAILYAENVWGFSSSFYNKEYPTVNDTSLFGQPLNLFGIAADETKFFKSYPHDRYNFALDFNGTESVVTGYINRLESLAANVLAGSQIAIGDSAEECNIYVTLVNAQDKTLATTLGEKALAHPAQVLYFTLDNDQKLNVTAFYDEINLGEGISWDAPEGGATLITANMWSGDGAVLGLKSVTIRKYNQIAKYGENYSGYAIDSTYFLTADEDDNLVATMEDPGEGNYFTLSADGDFTNQLFVEYFTKNVTVQESIGVTGDIIPSDIEFKYYTPESVVDGTDGFTVAVNHPNNEVWYWADEEAEIAASNDTNAFTGYSDIERNNPLTLVSHTFENGKGVLKFDNDVVWWGYYQEDDDSIASILFPDNFAEGEYNHITRLSFPASIRAIGNYSLYQSYDCTEIDGLENVTILDGGAFYGSGIETFEPWDNLENILSTYFLFSDCHNLTDVVFPEYVTEFEKYTLDCCYSLNNITILANTVVTLNDTDVFTDTDMTTVNIYVPAALVDAYKADEGWSEYADRIQAIPE